MKKRVLAVILGAVMTMSLAACGSSDAGKTSSNDSEKSYTIGISQFAEHGSLDNCREGFLEGLKEEGIEEGKNLTVEVKNAAADQGTVMDLFQTKWILYVQSQHQVHRQLTIQQ